jgi:DNA helicase INO80
MDRTHRLGQTRQVTVYRLLARGTIEESIVKRARQKQRIHSLVTEGAAATELPVRLFTLFIVC